jgi:exodeoxyribonuclease V beta subunit
MTRPSVALDAQLCGTSLIEASAGTGKTWTISGLYLRLVAEKGLAVEQILTVTFTRAATAELRERIRARLQGMTDTLAGREAGDELCATLARRLADPELARRRLAAALASFDDAAVYTIHGFCQRALAERAFSSGTPFRSDILANVCAVLEAVVQDFWRREIVRPGTLPPELHERFVAYLLARGVTPQSLAAWTGRLLGKHGMGIEAGDAAHDPGEADRALRELHGRLAALWRGERHTLLALLRDSPHLNRNGYKLASLPEWAAQLDAYFGAGGDPAAPPPCFDKFTAARLAASLKKNGTPPRHAFFELADGLAPLVERAGAAFESLFADLRRRLLAYAREEMPRRLREERLQAYDDLLRNLHEAIHGPGGERLAAALRSRYPAALIDEFQDTDPLQYAIFRRIYRDGGDTALFLVGDPKQAIYSFRGADVFAYLAAARASERQYALDTNQRSVPALVAALNALFEGATRPFRFEAIDYRPVAAARKEHAQLVEDGRADEAPLRFFLAPAADDRLLGKGEAGRWAARTTAAEIARLLNASAAGSLRLGGEPLQARHIAVLVNDHFQAAAVRAALREAGVACAEQSRESVFHSAEAEELERLMLAVAEPQREGLVRAALAGMFFGLDGAGLSALDDDELAWERRLADLRRYHELWRDTGFMGMLRRLMAEQEVAPRLARRADGERCLTNLFHLAELLHTRGEYLHGMEALVNWLASQRREAGDEEEAQLRLESDENLVQVVTIHRSKGLEYPVTFCPFLWQGRSHVAKAGEFFYHDPQRDYAPVLDLGSPRAPQAQAAAREEELAERLRLAYVALTRARNRCYVMWGRMREAAASPLGWLLHRCEGGDDSLPTEERLRDDLERLAHAANGALRVEPAPPEQRLAVATAERADGLAARSVTRPVPPAWRLASFSSLLHAAGEEWRAELPDYDRRLPEAPEVRAAGGGRFAFPRGSGAGTCLHGVLESIDFAAPEPAWREAAAAHLVRAGFPVEWRAAVSEWLRQVAATPLAPALSLARLPRRATLRELEFHLPLERADLRRVNEIVARHGLLAPPLPPEKLQGYLKGFIDLVFEHDGRYYLADYKSNWLGESAADYRQAALAAAMAREGYGLQYLLYTLAVHRWLRLRLPGYDYERHFGGAYYLFLRGMAPGWEDEAGKSMGVYFARPPRALVEELDRLLSPPGRETA